MKEPGSGDDRKRGKTKSKKKPKDVQEKKREQMPKPADVNKGEVEKRVDPESPDGIPFALYSRRTKNMDASPVEACPECGHGFRVHPREKEVQCPHCFEFLALDPAKELEAPTPDPKAEAKQAKERKKAQKAAEKERRMQEKVAEKERKKLDKKKDETPAAEVVPVGEARDDEDLTFSMEETLEASPAMKQDEPHPGPASTVQDEPASDEPEFFDLEEEPLERDEAPAATEKPPVAQTPDVQEPVEPEPARSDASNNHGAPESSKPVVESRQERVSEQTGIPDPLVAEPVEDEEELAALPSFELDPQPTDRPERGADEAGSPRGSRKGLKRLLGRRSG